MTTNVKIKGKTKTGILLAVMAMTMLALMPAAGFAAEEAVSKKPIKPKVVLTKKQRWGYCLSCHSDKNLSKIVNGKKEESLHVDSRVLGKSAHKQIACVDCHTNFNVSDAHPVTTPQDYRKVAGLACQKCHPYQWNKYKDSVHGKAALTNKDKFALCSDCHGSHDIRIVSTKNGDKNYREENRWVCKKCHEKAANQYDDYYHGKAYQFKAPDAPACWDCHDNHSIQKKDDLNSTVNKQNIAKTCDKCHDEASDAFTSYGEMIHGYPKLLNKNPLYKLIKPFLPAESKISEVKEQKEEGIIGKIINFFFPPSLRPKK